MPSNLMTLGHESARVTATGRTYHSDFAFVFRVRNGKLTAFRAYHDTDAMMRATAV
jgi:ketosteroid isomerase-like protein